MSKPLSFSHLAHRVSAAAVASFALLAGFSAAAANVTWNLNNAGNWDTTAANWAGDSTLFTEGDAVTFGSVITAGRTITIQAGGVTPTSTVVQNAPVSAAAGYTFSGGNVLGGSLTHSASNTTTFTQNANQGFSSVAVEQSTLCWAPVAGSDAAVLASHAFTVGTLTLGTGSTLGRFYFRANRNVAYTFEQDVAVNAGGGTLDLGNNNATATSYALNGDITLGGALTVEQTSRPLTLTGTLSAAGGTRRIAFPTSSGVPDFSQTTIASVFGGSSVIEISQNAATQFRTLHVSGDNSAFTGGFALHNRGILVFDSVNAMGGGAAGSITAPNNTYCGFAFANFGGSSTVGALSKIATASQGNLGLEADSSAAIDLTGFHTNIRLGSATRATYSGTLTPQAADYRLGGGGGHLTVSSVLDGATRTLSHNNVGSVPPSITTLTAANTYGGVTAVGSGILAVRGASARVGAGATTVSSGAALCLTHPEQVPDAANLTVNSGGVLILDGMSYADFIASRSGPGTTTLGGFAGRNGTLHVTTGTFDRDLTFGFGQKDYDGSYYANAGVKLGAAGTLTAQRLITFAGSPSPTVNNNFSLAPPVVFHELSGNVSGTGSLAVDVGSQGEIILSGLNSWTGSPTRSLSNGATVTAGPGGFIIGPTDGGSGGLGTARFAGAASLPTGNGGSPAFLVSGHNGGNPNEPRIGLLMTPKAPTGPSDTTGEVYRLPTGYKFFVGTPHDSWQKTPYLGTGTSDGSGGIATLSNARVLLHRRAATTTGSAGICVRDGLWVLGLPFDDKGDGDPANDDGPVTFEVSCNFTDTDGSVGPTPGVSGGYKDSSAARGLLKIAPGTVVLRNVRYRQPIGGAVADSQVTWTLGRSAANSGATSYFDGAVRGLCPGDPQAGSSNSLAYGPALQLRGGVYEVDA